MKTKQDISYGVIPIYKEGSEYQVLIVHQISYRGDSFWILPKGHAEEGESPVEVARRELREETGVTDVELDTKKTFSMSYSFFHQGTKIEKTVIYYPGIVGSKEVEISQPREILELRWCAFPEAKATLTHDNTKKILVEVEKYLLTNKIKVA